MKLASIAKPLALASILGLGTSNTPAADVQFYFQSTLDRMSTNAMAWPLPGATVGSKIDGCVSVNTRDVSRIYETPDQTGSAFYGPAAQISYTLNDGTNTYTFPARNHVGFGYYASGPNKRTYYLRCWIYSPAETIEMLTEHGISDIAAQESMPETLRKVFTPLTTSGTLSKRFGIGGHPDYPTAFASNFVASAKASLSVSLGATNANTILLSWPSFAGNFQLQSRTNLTTAPWVDCPATPALDATYGEYSVTIPANNPSEFFKLR